MIVRLKMYSILKHKYYMYFHPFLDANCHEEPSTLTRDKTTDVGGGHKPSE